MTGSFRRLENQLGKMVGIWRFTPCVMLVVAICFGAACCTGFTADSQPPVSTTAAKPTSASKSQGDQLKDRRPDSEEHRIQPYDALKISVYQEPDASVIPSEETA